MEYQKKKKKKKKIDNKTADVLAKWYETELWKPQKIHNKIIASENDKEISKERYVSPDERQRIIDNLYINII